MSAFETEVTDRVTATLPTEPGSEPDVELTFQEQAVLWGQAYEVLVKRGVLACLIEQRLVQADRLGLTQWSETKLLEVSRRLCHHLDLVDPAGKDVVNAAVRHLALTAYGVGYTAMRAYLKQVRLQFKNPDELKVRALWCPLTLPGESTLEQSARKEMHTAFATEFGLTGLVDSDWSRKGQPANSDFTLWLTCEGPRDDFLLVQEYSYSMPPALQDFREQGGHLDELMRHRRIVDSRSVFARVAAEVDGEEFQLSGDIKNYLGALTSHDKPLHKLCQASSYAQTTVALLHHRGLLTKACVGRALAITPNGLESLAARYAPGVTPEPRCKLMAQMAAAYRETEKLRDGDTAGLQAQVEVVFQGMLKKLPVALRKALKALPGALPAPGEDFTFNLAEQVPKFANPTQEFSLDEAGALVEQTDELQRYFGGDARKAVGATMLEFAEGRPTLSLRDVHATAIVAGLQRAERATLNVLALEGNPGIGKTTAIRTHLGMKQDGYLFLYVSPRVVINRDVTESLARDDDKQPTGILTLTTNAQIIASAERWHAKQVELRLDTKRRISCAVVADGVNALVKPENSPLLVLAPKDEEEIDSEHAAANLKKDQLSEHEDLVKDRPLMGVLTGLALTAKELLTLNPGVNRMVLTAALQGFRQRSNKSTTIEALSKLFDNPAKHEAGREERRQFAKRMPTIVVMVDELAGDGAGALFVHSVAEWLDNEFLACFEDAGEESPFTVTLVVSDASLGNEVVLERYLNAGDQTPDKVLVSKSVGDRPFRLAVTDVRIARRKRKTLHVMTNSFPASELYIHYRVKMTALTLEESMSTPGQKQSPREAIRVQAGDALKANAVRDVQHALDQGARQVIYFAQDKLFLRDLRAALLSEEPSRLHADKVHVIDASVPGWKRKKLLSPEVRDVAQVFLMTSSGARGVSFPLTDWIIASMPRFSIEAALMEIAQLIYRGRGRYKDESGQTVSGDNVPRHLVMTVDDYLVSEEQMDKRQWLAQSIDLMRLLVMLRSTILTRITGDADLRQPLALVPVGAVGLDELVSLMSQYVSQFMKEAELFKKHGKNKELQALAGRAQANVDEIFSRTKLHGVSKRGADGRTLVKVECMRELTELATTSISSLLVSAESGTSLPEHVSFSGPAVVETWADFEKQEVFAFEGHETQLSKASRSLMGQLQAIDEAKEFPSALRRPASNLRRLLQREHHESANEFRTLKDLKSPNTWVAVPAGHYQFMFSETAADGRPFRLDDQALWQEALGRTLNAGSAVMPPLPKYESFPWAAAVGEVSPLKLDLVFDDRYFMASNELNLLNTLLLANENADTGEE